MEKPQIEPSRQLTPSPAKGSRQFEDIPQEQRQKKDPEILAVNQWQNGQKELDNTQVNFRIVQMLQQIQQGMPQQTQKQTHNQATLKFTSAKTLCLLITSVLLSSILSVAFCYAMIIYGHITISPLQNHSKNDMLTRVSQLAPTENTTQSITSNQFCGTINLNIQKGTTISNKVLTQSLPSLQEGWVYFDQPKQVFSFSFNNINENVFNFTSVIPKDIKIKYIKLIIWNNVGHSNEDYYRYYIRTRVVQSNKQWVHWTVGSRYRQSAFTFNSESVIVPCSQSREIRFQTWRIQHGGHLLYLITGYLPDSQ